MDKKKKREEKAKFGLNPTGKMVGVLLLVVLLLENTLSVFAQETSATEQSDKNWLPRVVDNAHLLSDTENQSLTEKLDEISSRQQCDVVVVTTDSLEGKGVVAYADDFFDYNGYGYGPDRDGILLLVCMGDRTYAISTSGYGIDAFTDYGLAYIEEQFLPDLGNGYYADAFTTFARECDRFLTEAKTVQPYDTNHEVGEEPFRPTVGIFVVTLVIAAAVGFLLALIMAAEKKSSLNTVAVKTQATEYLKEFKLSRKQDQYIRSTTTSNTVTKSTERSSSDGGGSSTHMSSSGRTHGGSHGSF